MIWPLPKDKNKETSQRSAVQGVRRLAFLRVTFGLIFIIIAGRLFVIQVLSHSFYEALASNAHQVFEQLIPVRGDILIRDQDNTLYPVATNRDTYILYAEPKNISSPALTARLLAPLLGKEEEGLADTLKGTKSYVRLARGWPEEEAEELRSLIQENDLSGIGLTREPARIYPEPAMGGHILGFVGFDEAGELRGRYGLEGYWDQELAGVQGSIAAETDVVGHWIPVANKKITPASDGADLILTIDRTVQFFACNKLKEAVDRFAASGGSVIIMDPKNGSILAMCGAPDFDPNNYSDVTDMATFNNPAIFNQYEPGSVMKAITMAAAVDLDKVGPKTTYVDEGEVKIGPYTIKNSDGQTHGRQTMTEVLEKSLNTGAIHVQDLIGVDGLRDYFKKFGFGQTTGIELSTEVAGTIASLSRRGDIFAATASYGQGITVTPMQLVTAFAALANGGELIKPRLVSEIIYPTYSEIKEKEVVRRVVSARTSTLLAGMLVSVVENGHGRPAAVPGYWVAGKTGTAQVARQDGQGYEKNVTIGSFVGFAPVEDPKFVISVRIDNPKGVHYAESTVAPVFGEIAKFLLKYYQIPSTRPI